MASRQHSHNANSGANRRMRLYIELAAITLAALLVALYLVTYMYAIPGHAKSLQPLSSYNPIRNLNISDIASMFPGSQYTPIMQGNISSFIPQLRNEGYVESSTSLFGLQAPKEYNGTRFPAVIVSYILLMANRTDASQSLGSMFFSNNVNQVNGSLVYNITRLGRTIPIDIHTVYSAAVFNASIARMLNITDTHMPDFQYASIFAYNNTVDAVYVNSYVQANNYSNISISLAEMLANKIAN